MSGVYERLFRHVLYPAYWGGLRRRKTLSWLAEYRRDQWLSPERIAELQWQRLKNLIEHCYREVPYYRSLWTRCGMQPGDIRSLEDYAKLPVLTKSDMRENFEDLKAESFRDRLLYKLTGGSTGDPFRFGFSRESNERRMAVMWRGYEWAGARMGRRSLYFWGGALGNRSRTRRIKDHLYHAAFGRHRVNSFEMNEANISEFADAIDRYRPEVIIAYTNPIVWLAQWMLDTGRKLHRPASIVCAAEPLHEFQRDILQRAFGCPAYNTYGCREFMLVASECEQRKGLHANADHLLVELRGFGNTITNEGSGELVITDLFNYGMPLMRYVNGDMATASNARCACGRGLPMLKRVDGRVMDVLRTPDGRMLPGEFFPQLFKDVAGVMRFQVVQRELDSLDLAIVRGEGFDDSSLQYIRREVGKVLGESVSLDMHFVDDIPLTISGKHRYTISKLPEGSV